MMRAIFWRRTSTVSAASSTMPFTELGLSARGRSQSGCIVIPSIFRVVHDWPS